MSPRTKAYVVTPEQAAALRGLYHSDNVSASDADRPALEGLVRRGMAVKNNVGRAVTYRITPAGRAIYKALGY